MKLSPEQIVLLRHTIYYNVYNSLIFIILTGIVIFAINSIAKRIQNTSIFSGMDENKSNARLILFIVIYIIIFVVVIATAWFIAMIDTKNGFIYTGVAVIVSVLLGLFMVFSLYVIVKIIGYKKREI